MRRRLFLYALLFAAPLRGAELVRPQAPVQLALPFAAPVTAMPLTSLAPVALPSALQAAPVRPPAAPVLSAPAPVPLAAVPPKSASPAVRDDGREDGRSQLQRLAQSADASGRAFDAPRRKTKMDYDEFSRQISAAPGLDPNPFRHADTKRRILAASGYTHLYGAGGSRIPLADAADVRVGNAFLSVKKTFDRR